MSFSVWREPVQDAWIDYNGHLSEAYYVLAFGHATDAVMEAVGLDRDYRAVEDASLYTVEAHVRYLDEVPADTDLEVRSTIIGVTAKLLWIWHELWAEGRLRATEEVLGVHVRGGSSSPLPAGAAARAREACGTPPPDAGRRIGPI
ncbi:MAG: thioesterase family protein [Nocardioides sp.]|uniref:thioesterase family protein n=1 Tax=Nocardioides sp. TaxID=35761 RepID=UPI0039E6AB4E